MQVNIPYLTPSPFKAVSTVHHSHFVAAGQVVGVDSLEEVGIRDVARVHDSPLEEAVVLQQGVGS